ncbi:MAG: C-terminal binding protein [Anaerolineae bacterium]|nr:C-terminal binding protein [Anaerolineae bacterium]
MSNRVVMLNYEYADLTHEREMLAAHNLEFEAGQCPTEDDIIAFAKGALGIINVYARITPRVAEALRGCKVMVRTGVGYDLIDVAACRANGIEVCNVPDYCINEVSDHAVGLLLAVQRKIVQHHRNVQAGIWDYKLVGPVRRLNELTLGLIGMGRIGRRFAAKMREMVPTILVYDPYAPKEAFESLGVQPATLEEIFQRCDLISLHTPLTAETRHMISAEAIAKMERKPILINVSRGGLVDTDALIAGLRAGQISGAGIDVLENEPSIPDGLADFDNVIVNPHASWYSTDAEMETRTRALEDVIRVIEGNPPRNPVP